MYLTLDAHAYGRETSWLENQTRQDLLFSFLGQSDLYSYLASVFAFQLSICTRWWRSTIYRYFRKLGLSSSLSLLVSFKNIRGERYRARGTLS